MDLYYIQVHARRLLPSAVTWISEDRLLVTGRQPVGSARGPRLCREGTALEGYAEGPGGLALAAL